MKISFLLFFLISIALSAVHAMDSVNNRQSKSFVSKFRIPWLCKNELYGAVCKRNLSEVRRLSEHQSVDPDGLFPLHKALELKQSAIAELLIARGAQVNRYNTLGETPLHVATGAGFTDGVTLLLNAGAQPNLPLTKHADYAPWGSTPLHCLLRSMQCSSQIHEQLLCLFLRKGADISAQEKVWGQTPVHLVTGNESLLRALVCSPHGVVYSSNQSTREFVESHLQHICSAFKIVDNNGVSPMEYAMLYGRSKGVLRLLSLNVAELERLFGSAIVQGYKMMLNVQEHE